MMIIITMALSLLIWLMCFILTLFHVV